MPKRGGQAAAKAGAVAAPSAIVQIQISTRTVKSRYRRTCLCTLRGLSDIMDILDICVEVADGIRSMACHQHQRHQRVNAGSRKPRKTRGSQNHSSIAGLNNGSSASCTQKKAPNLGRHQRTDLSMSKLSGGYSGSFMEREIIGQFGWLLRCHNGAGGVTLCTIPATY